MHSAVAKLQLLEELASGLLLRWISSQVRVAVKWP